MAAAFPGYFETQQQARCGLHAMRNAIGQQLFTAEDLKEACDRYIADKAAVDGLQDGEEASWHSAPSGWYSIEVMAFTLRNTHLFFGAGAPTWAVVLAELRHNEAVFHEPGVVGAVSNWPGHWVAIRKEGGQAWLLDSLSRPRLLTPASLSAFFKRWPLTYAVRRDGAPHEEPDFRDAAVPLEEGAP